MELRLLKYPDPRLQMVCDPVSDSQLFQRGSELHELLDGMWTLLKAYNGYGLAAPQVGAPTRAVIIHCPGGCKVELVNPVIDKRWGGRFMSDEGCLSWPGKRIKVLRDRQVKVSGLDRWGDPVAFGGKNLQAAALQHEIEHLDGINLADRVKVA